MATNSEPFEVIAGPIEVYRAPVATTFPVIGAAPAVDWTLIGKNGSKDYAESARYRYCDLVFTRSQRAC